MEMQEDDLKYIKLLYQLTDPLLKDFNHNRPSQVLPYLFMGSKKLSEQVQTLKNSQISAVLNLAPSIGSMTRYSYPSDWKYKEIYAVDSDDYPLNNHFNEIYEYIIECKNDNRIIFVHCGVGISRASTAVISYLLKALEKGDESIESLQSFRNEYLNCKQIEEVFESEFEARNNAVRLFYTCFLHVLFCRVIIEPNSGFLKLLIQYSYELFEK